MRTLLTTSMLLLVAQWAVADDKKEEAKLDLFPLVKGTKWQYEITTGGQKKAMDQEVTALAPGKKGERDIATVTTKVGEQTIVEEVSADDKGVYRHSFQGMKLETPLAIAKYPYKVGAKWKGPVKIGKEEAEANFEMFEPEAVEVAAGKYTAYPVVMEMETMGQKIISKNWYADGVGIVKQVVEFPAAKLTMELKAFTKAK